MRFLWPRNCSGCCWRCPCWRQRYFYLLARRKKAAVLYASLALPRAALGPGQRHRPHIPPAAFPGWPWPLRCWPARAPSATDHPAHRHLHAGACRWTSRAAWRPRDIQPTRIDARAQQAARDFITDLPASVRLGIVAFAAAAAVVQPPTDNRAGHARRHRSLRAAARHGHRQRVARWRWPR